MRSLLTLAFCCSVFFVFVGNLPATETNATPDSKKSLAIANGDFQTASENVPQAWKWWSRDKAGKVEYVTDEGHAASGTARIKHDGDRDFAYSSVTRIPVTPGQSFKARAWVKPIEGKVELAIVALSGKNTLDWWMGRSTTYEKDLGKWTALTAKAVVPEGCDAMYVRFVGKSKAEALVDDVSIEPWDWREANKPKVKGFAKKRIEEKLDRGLVVRRLDENRFYLSWRLLKSDPKMIAFNVYLRQTPDAAPQCVTSSPIQDTTDFTLTLPPKLQGKADTLVWSICPVVNGKELAEVKPTCASKDIIKPDQPIVLPLQGEKDTFQKVGIADLDGDGSLDYVLKRPRENIDPYINYWKPSPETIKLDAYRNDGKLLWTHDLGWSIERGIWYSPYLVYDFNGDGRAEVVAKTGVGDPREKDGRVRTGDEFVTVFDGLTGKPIAQAPWPSREGFDGERGYNYASRNQLGVAYLDGKTPCLIVARGTYNLMKVVAYQLHDGKLQELWRWNNRDVPGNYWGQGAHWMHGVDVDADGRDEVILGSVTLDDNGVSLWTTGLGHPDHLYVGDLDPARPGLEIYYGIERRQKKNGMCMVDAATGEILWGHDKPTTHIHSSGLCGDIDASHPGSECYSGERDAKQDRWLRTAQGEVIQHPCDLGGLAPRSAYWDADPQRELIRGGNVQNYPDGVCGKISGSFIQTVDVLGDWREEIITSVDGQMRIYMTTIPAQDRRPCLMQDPIYRIDVAHGAMGYTQVPSLSYDMASEAEKK